MHRLIEFIKRIYVFVIFLVLESLALWSYASSSPYTEAKILSRTTAVGSAISGTITDIGQYFSLASENRMLTERIATLSEQLEIAAANDTVALDASHISIQESLHFRYRPASVISMTTNRPNNHIILDKGSKDGIAKDMGVITPDNKLIGYVTSCTDHYSVVQPMLNVNFSTGGRLMDNGHVCVIHWNQGSKYEVEAVELSVYSDPQVGMAVEVRSERLPDGVLIGHIESFEMNTAKSAYSATIRIAADMASLDNVLIVENTHYGEIETLLQQAE